MHFYSDENMRIWKNFFEKQASHVAIHMHRIGRTRPPFQSNKHLKSVRNVSICSEYIFDL